MPESVAVQQPEEVLVDAASEIGSTVARRSAALPSHDEPVGPGSILQLLDKAMDKGVPVEALEKLQAMLERVSDRAAAREFADALARFQELCPPIVKNARASFATQGGGKMEYRYAELDHIARTIRPHLKACGLSYSWNSKMDGATTMIVRCTLRHVNGHQEASDFPVPTETKAAMSSAQKHGAALTYARRQSLVQVLGITTSETDTDAANPTPITQDQADDLRALIQEVAPAKVAAVTKRLLKFAKAERLEEIPAAQLASVMNALKEYGAAKVDGDAKEPAK